MSKDEGVEILLLLESHKYEPAEMSEAEIEELLKFFCGEEEEEDGTTGS